MACPTKSRDASLFAWLDCYGCIENLLITRFKWVADIINYYTPNILSAVSSRPFTLYILKKKKIYVKLKYWCGRVEVPNYS